jgi:hypothetical protein
VMLAYWTTAASLLTVLGAHGPGVVDSSQVREDPEASKRDWAWLEAHQAREEQDHRLRWDRERMKKHAGVLTAIRQLRARQDRARSKRALETARDATRASAAGIRRQVHEIDPWRNGSYVLDDYEAMLQLLERRYPAALLAALEKQPNELARVRAELDARLKKVRSWLARAAEHEDEEGD